MALLSRLSFAPTEEGDSGVGEWGGKGREEKGRGGGDKGHSRRGIKLVYRPVKTDSSGFNIPLFFFLFFFYFYFCRRRDNSIERKQKRKKKGEEKKENARRDGN